MILPVLLTAIVLAAHIGDDCQEAQTLGRKAYEARQYDQAAQHFARALKAAGNRVVAIVGARTRELLLLEDEMRQASESLHVMTDDGSRGERGVVTARLAGLYAAGERPGLVLAIGPVPMMRAVAETTRPFGTRTVVSLNPIMVDGTGMCGGCRVVVGGVSRFACVDGPEFDAHAVDFELLARRNAAYRDAERRSLERWVLLASLAAVGLFFLLQIAWNWQGGGGFVGNRYYVNVYPAFLFLVTRIRPPALLAAGFAAGGLFLTPLLVSPFGMPVVEPTLQAHVRSRPFRPFPLELTLRNVPGYHRFPVAASACRS